jgi:hypothetical protein
VSSEAIFGEKLGPMSERIEGTLPFAAGDMGDAPSVTGVTGI